MRSDQVTATFYKCGYLLALAIRERRNVGQDQCSIVLKVLRIQELIVHHVKRYACLNKRLIKAQRMIFDFSAGLLTTIEGRRLLRVNHGHFGKRSLIAKVA